MTDEGRQPQSRDYSLLLVSIPKSGTVYMNEMFAKGLGLQNAVISNRYFPVDQLHFDLMPTFAKGGQVASVHIDPSPENLQLLNACSIKWSVHFRDPRSVLLSWVYHVTRLATEEQWNSLLAVIPTPPRALFDWDFQRKIDWHIDNFSPHVTKWMLGWLKAAEEMPDKIIITEYSELRENEAALADKILSFVGIPRSHYIHKPPAKNMNVHFRTGAYDEWRDVLTREQQQKARSLIPASLMERFSWAE